MKRKFIKSLIVLTLCCIMLSGCTEEEKTKMDYGDLYVNASDRKIRLNIGMDENNVRNLMGEPTSRVDSREDKSVFEGKGFIYGDYVDLTYGNTRLLFYSTNDTKEFSLAEIYASDDSIIFARDTKVGMTKKEIMAKFYENEEKKKVAYEDGEPWGELIYGDYVNYEFDSNKIKSPYYYACLNYSGNYIEYNIVTAANDRTNIKSGDQNASMVFYFNLEDIVESIRVTLNPTLK